MYIRYDLKLKYLYPHAMAIFFFLYKVCHTESHAKSRSKFSIYLGLRIFLNDLRRVF